MNSPSTLAKESLVAPQNEQCPAVSVTGSRPRWSVADGGDIPAADPTVGVGPQLSLQLHPAPDPGAVDPNIGLDVGGRRLTDAAQLG